MLSCSTVQVTLYRVYLGFLRHAMVGQSHRRLNFLAVNTFVYLAPHLLLKRSILTILICLA
jgi:hypothetical protein